MEKKHKGARAELVACAWLLKQGYEVYRNVSPWGLCDVLATRNGEFFKFDVKTMGGGIVIARLTRAQIEDGVMLLGVLDDGCCIINPAVPDYGSGTCKECGATFKKTQTNHVFCQKSCTVKYCGRAQLARARLTRQSKSAYRNTSSQNTPLIEL
jgi:hypothetical protein